MQAVIKLEAMGFQFSLIGDKLNMKSNGQPNSMAASLIAEIKERKQDAIAYLQKRQNEAHEIIKRAYRGELRHAALIEPLSDWSCIWGSAVWLCPDDTSKQTIRKKYPNTLALLVNDFFKVCELIATQGKDSKGVLECLKVFGGSLNYAPDAFASDIVDSGADISPDDSALWVRVLEMAKVVSIDLVARLRYLRGAGCKLMQNNGTGFKLIPIIDSTGRNGWINQESYDAEKWCLNPYRQQLVELFQKLKDVNK